MNKIKYVIKLLKEEKNLRGYIIRMGLFFVLFAVIFKFHHIFTATFLHYSYSNYISFLEYLIYPFFILFSILRWEKIKEMKSYKNNMLQTIGFALLSVLCFMAPLKYVYLALTNIPHDFIYFGAVIPGYIFLFIAIFNFKFIKKFNSELFSIVYLFILFLALQVITEKFWVPLSGLILLSLNYILPLFSNSVSIDPSQLAVTMNDFSVTVGATCAGFYSLITFALLYVGSVLLLKQKNDIHNLKAAVALIIGLICAFILNIIRVATIVIIGALYSAELALELFHEYMSAVLLIALFMGYLYFVFPKIVKPKVNESLT